jgi:hypothetical protein
MELKDQKKELLNMEFDTRRQRQSDMVEFINRFMQERTIKDVRASQSLGTIIAGPKKTAFVKTVYKPVPL